MTVVPPIPATCEGRPTVGGLVVPWVNTRLADGGVDFRAQHNARHEACWRERRCQVCGLLLTQPAVLVGGPEALKQLVFAEPPMHPECAVYTSRACPMVAGRMSHFAVGEPVSNRKRGKTCPVEGCDCGGWIENTTHAPQREGEPAHAWYAVYVAKYNLALNPDRTVLGGQVDPADVRVVRLISTPGQGRCWRTVPDALASYEPPEMVDA